MVPAWAVVIAAAALAQPGQPAALPWMCLVLLGAGYAAFVMSTSSRPWYLLLPMALGALAVAEFGAIGRGLAGYPMLALWLNLATLTLGILLPMRHAAVAALTLVAVSMALVWHDHASDAVPLDRSALLSVGTIALAMGMLVAVPAGMLRRTAEDSDSLAAAGAAAAVDAAILDGRRGELRRVQRILHDTVMNTLGAVARWDASDPALVATRCAADLAILRRADVAGQDDPGVLLESLGRRADLLGVSMDLLAPDPGPALPPGVAAALEGAAWETLNNISKHVSDRRALVDWSWDGHTGRLRLTDAGPGVDGLSWTRGGAESIVRRCSEAGIDAQVRSAAGSGTVVELDWNSDSGPTGDEQGGDEDAKLPGQSLPHLFAETLVRVCLVVAVVGVIATAALPGATVRGSSLLGVLAVVTLGGGAWAVQRGRATWRMPGGLYPVLALLGTWFTGFGLEGCSRVGSWWWGSLVGIAVCVAAILMDGRKRVAVAAAAGFAAGNALVALGLGPGTAACHPDVVVDTFVALAGLAGLWAFRRQLISTWELASEQQAMLAREQSRAAAAVEAIRARQSMLGLARSVAEPVLVGLAEGELDPADPATRARAARAEGILRALAAVPVADVGGAGRALTGLVLSAHDRGLELTLSLSADLDQSPDTVLEGAGMLDRALGSCPEGSAVQVTVLQADHGMQCLVLIDPRTSVQGKGGLVPAASQRCAGDDGATHDSTGRLDRTLAAEGWTVTLAGDEILAETRWEDPA